MPNLPKKNCAQSENYYYVALNACRYKVLLGGTLDESQQTPVA